MRVRACGVCRTDLHVVDGDLRDPKLPLIPGHQIVGEVVETGEHVEWFAPGYRVGVPWLNWTCGRCRYCLSGRENLCDDARFTGYQIDGGYAEYAVADYRFCFPVSDAPDLQVAPLLCAGLIGYRSLRMTGDAEREEEAWLLRFAAAELDSDILKVAHHGSSTSSGEKFLAAVTPSLAIISVGADNLYGHPSADVLAALSRTGARTIRTDHAGTVVVRTDGSRITVKGSGEEWDISQK